MMYAKWRVDIYTGFTFYQVQIFMCKFTFRIKKKQTSNDNYKINKYYSIYILYIYKTTNSI